MTLRVSGKQVDVGESLRNYAEARIAESVEKYFDGSFSGHMTLEKEGIGFKSDCVVHLDTGMVLQASGSDGDPQKSFELAAEHIEKRLRRYKRKLKNHRNEKNLAIEAAYGVLEHPDAHEEVAEDFTPVVIAESTSPIRAMSVGDAVMELDLVDAPVVVFRNAGDDGINIVYKRKDGHIGWVNPTLAK
ncbi:ribosome hibernation-promoting factor, HPF/YfiA family [Cohaesibacter gelatinilyticus]|uniref:Ribosome hibernation promoting factor n=1 Tax=Cohaesibacter gelatinilyticus TaxID=372072 RepID=A0A285PLC9_9HYPH|nr:ribosome-associated translation inhibitor RaiA [Cohaesibacter gelatinilyticus]SNZ20671.1 ribosomal subunit interface protein [Cohaesibacter gelatinilyticus]